MKRLVSGVFILTRSLADGFRLFATGLVLAWAVVCWLRGRRDGFAAARTASSCSGVRETPGRPTMAVAGSPGISRGRKKLIVAAAH